MLELRSVFKREIEEYLALRKKTLTPESYGSYLYALRNFDEYLSERGITIANYNENGLEWRV